jgi:Na+-driven multidrug efflux pump
MILLSCAHFETHLSNVSTWFVIILWRTLSCVSRRIGCAAFRRQAKTIRISCLWCMVCSSAVCALTSRLLDEAFKHYLPQHQGSFSSRKRINDRVIDAAIYLVVALLFWILIPLMSVSHLLLSFSPYTWWSIICRYWFGSQGTSNRNCTRD